MQKFGIDVSRWQGDFDFTGAKETDGIEFAIIKCGGADDGLYTDSRFEDNYSKLSKTDIHAGAYFYGNAFSTEEAEKEAEYCAQILTDKKFCYPIFYDIEGAMLTGENLTDIALAFMRKLKGAGYEKVGVYSSESHFNSYFDLQAIKNEGFYVWCARYSDTEPSLVVDYDIWQFGGSVNYIRNPEINGQTVDQNYCYTDFCTNCSNDNNSSDNNEQPQEDNAETGITKGSKVKVLDNLTYDGSRFEMYYDEYDVLEVNGDRIVIGIGNIVTAAVNSANLELIGAGETQESTEESDNNINVGDTVIFNGNADYNGTAVTAWHNDEGYTVSEISGDRAVLTYNDDVFAAVNISDLQKK